MNKLRLLTVRLDEGEHEFLKEFAAATRQDMSEIVRKHIHALMTAANSHNGKTLYQLFGKEGGESPSINV